MRMGEGAGRRALRVGILCLALMAIVPAWAESPPRDASGFTSYVAKAFAQAVPAATVAVVSPLTVSVATAVGGRNTLYLYSLYSQCQRDPDGCDDAIASWIDQMGAVAVDKPPPVDRAMLRAVLRPAAVVDQIGRAYHEEPVASPFLAGLWTICVVDRPTAIEYPTWKELSALGLSRAQLLMLCQANTLAALGPVRPSAKDAPWNGISLISDDPYESSRLLAPESWTALAGKNGQLMVSAPGTDVLLYIRATDSAAVVALATLTRELAKRAPRPLSTAIFRWTPKGWVVVAPPH